MWYVAAFKVLVLDLSTFRQKLFQCSQERSYRQNKSDKVSILQSQSHWIYVILFYWGCIKLICHPPGVTHHLPCCTNSYLVELGCDKTRFCDEFKICLNKVQYCAEYQFATSPVQSSRCLFSAPCEVYYS